MKILNFKNKVNKALFDRLDNFLVLKGFDNAVINLSSRSDIARWKKDLNGSLIAVISITLNPALDPDIWSIEPLVIIESSFVAGQSNNLRLERDCCSITSSWKEPTSHQVLRFLPAHIRWQQDWGIKYPTLKGRPEMLSEMIQEFSNVFDQYVEPILSEMTSPLAVAEFQLRAAVDFKSTRLPIVQPRYKVMAEYISTALLFLEAEKPERGLSLLEKAVEEKQTIISTMSEHNAIKLYCKIEKLINYFKSMKNKVE